MAKQNQAAEAKSDKKSRPKTKPVVVTKSAGALAGGLAEFPAGPIGAADGGTIQAQAAQLSDLRLQSTQRQALAAQIGQAQGNQHLQRVVALLKRDEKVATARIVQRTNGGPATITGAPADTVTKVCIFRIEDDPFIQNMRQYVINTLGVPEEDVMWVNSVEHMFQRLAGLEAGEAGEAGGAPTPRVNRLILVSHARSTEYAGSPAYTESRVRGAEGWIEPSDVTQAAQSPLGRRVRESVMAPEAIVEFWGCRLGQSISAMGTWGRALLPGRGSEFRAPTVQTEILSYNPPEFFRRPRRDERGERIRGRRGRWVRFTNTDQVPSGEQDAFRQRLLEIYDALVANREIREPVIPPDQVDRRFEHMSRLYNRSNGEIRTMRLIASTDGGEQEVAPGEEQWPGLWQTQRYNVTWDW